MHLILVASTCNVLLFFPTTAYSSLKICTFSTAQSMPTSIMLTLFMSTYLSYLVPSHVSANLVNVTVDDQGVDPLTGASISYTPLSIRAWSLGQLCDECNARPDPAQTLNGTWHHAVYNTDSDVWEGSLPQTATFSFSGSALYLFGIIHLPRDDQTSSAKYTFSIDGERVGRFNGDDSDLFEDPSQSEYLYHQVLYSNSSIPNGLHSFTVQNGQIGGDFTTILLDYLIYSTDDTVESSLAPQSATSTATLPISSSGNPTMTGHFTISTESRSMSHPVSATSSTKTSGLMSTSTVTAASSGGHSSSTTSASSSSRHRTVVICASVISSCVAILLFSFLFIRRRRGRRNMRPGRPSFISKHGKPFIRETVQRKTSNRVSNNDASSSVILIGGPPMERQASTSALEHTEERSVPSSSMLCNPRTTPTIDPLSPYQPHPYVAPVLPRSS
ncbi:hypothetical protein PHLGIDRAFT_201620 [Phlebiopsis gigantea 11061_1 CR5-6]|uniref:Uncharacterized protein n=1 Tax=Phlebiopsis gigantea (strain 11061_1 CR5-6) TaxID=745531 RepID=A0A0C3RTZ4_PHLG1|nr:hypothetical protein PHLGIDRAFT_201620 [Phlebiopsis gigantea 11061_1 CR5-6]